MNSNLFIFWLNRPNKYRVAKLRIIACRWSFKYVYGVIGSNILIAINDPLSLHGGCSRLRMLLLPKLVLSMRPLFCIPQTAWNAAVWGLWRPRRKWMVGLPTATPCPSLPRTSSTRPGQSKWCPQRSRPMGDSDNHHHLSTPITPL